MNGLLANTFIMSSRKTETMYLMSSFRKQVWYCQNSTGLTIFTTVKSQIEGHTHLLIFRKFSTLPAVIWAYPFINFQENFKPPCFFTYTNEIISILHKIIRAYQRGRNREEKTDAFSKGHTLIRKSPRVQ